MRYTPLDKINLLANIYVRMLIAVFKFRTWSGFFLLAMFQLAGLYALANFYLPGLYQIIFPIISKFVSPQFLHYPGYYMALPSVLSSFDRFVLGPTVWVILSAFAVLRLDGFYRGERIPLRAGLKKAASAYFPLLLFWGFETVLVLVAVVFPSKFAADLVAASLKRRTALGLAVQMAAFLISACFVYTIPGVMIESKRLGEAIVKSVRLCMKNFFLTYFFVSVPGMVYFTIDIFLKEFSDRVMQMMIPEAILLILGVRIVLGIFVNLFIYGTAVFVYREMA